VHVHARTHTHTNKHTPHTYYIHFKPEKSSYINSRKSSIIIIKKMTMVVMVVLMMMIHNIDVHLFLLSLFNGMIFLKYTQVLQHGYNCCGCTHGIYLVFRLHIYLLLTG